MNYITIPNLPDRKVKKVIISSCVSEDVIKDLTNKGISAIMVPPCGDVAPPVSSHTDMLFHHLGGNNILCYKNASNLVLEQLKLFGFNVASSSSELNPNYPYDIALNAARIGNYIFCNVKYTDKLILEFCKRQGLHIVPVKQGYAKCSVCVVNENSIITADNSIFHAAKSCGMNVLKIRSGFINLPGYDYGFIGGCCGKIAPDTMAFCGDVTMHPDYNEISDFLRNYGVKIIILGKGSLLDIGSIIPLIE